MLKTIDRFLIKKYLSTFLFLVLIFSMVVMAIDTSDKIQSFLETECTIKEIFFDYFFGFVMYMTGMLIPIYILVSVVYFTSKMAENSEIISIFNAGVSFRRLLRPYLVAASIVTVFHLGMTHFLVPMANKNRLHFERTYVWTDKEQVRGSQVHFQVAPDTKVYIRSYDRNSKIARDFHIEQIQNNKLVSLTTARSAKWQEELGKWRLDGYSVRTFDGLDETWERIPSRSLDTLLDLTPADFVFYHNENEEMTTPELQVVLDRDKRRGQLNKLFEIEKYRRTAEPFTSIILTIIGLAIAGRKVRGGMGLHLAIGIGIGALYIMLSKFAISFASSGSMPILLGMWLPNIIFALVAAVLMLRSQN